MLTLQIEPHAAPLAGFTKELQAPQGSSKKAERQSSSLVDKLTCCSQKAKGRRRWAMAEQKSGAAPAGEPSPEKWE